MRIGIVCPYSFDVPGGVQFHVRDLAEHLIGRGRSVSVLAPADDDTPLPWYVEAAGRAVPVKYNGSVARRAVGSVGGAGGGGGLGGRGEFGAGGGGVGGGVAGRRPVDRPAPERADLAVPVDARAVGRDRPDRG